MIFGKVTTNKILRDLPGGVLPFVFVNECGFNTMILSCRFKRSRNPAALAPFLPLSFIVAYQADYVYGSKMNRIRG